MIYKVTVNGVSYDVEVEPVSGGSVVNSEETVALDSGFASSSTAAGSEGVTADVAGKIFKIVAMPGDTVVAGDAIVILEAMKMEIPVVAPKDGVVASIEVKEGDGVEVGYLIATMN